MGVILRATFIYWILLFILRLIGRRAVSQLTPFEFLVVFLLGGMSIQSVVSDDRSVTAALLGILTIALNHFVVSALKQRSTRFRKLVDGVPVIVVRDGEINARLLHSLRMVEEDILAIARQNGRKTLERIELAIVERDGSVSMIQKK
jgi:uncharacterized membrane protein YcaP (DUF421 family)